jgi:hypothetical protein
VIRIVDAHRHDRRRRAPSLEAAHPAEARYVRVYPHLPMKPHISHVAAIPGTRYAEHIPQSRAVARGRSRIEDRRVGRSV